MRLITKELLAEFSNHDPVLQMIKQQGRPEDYRFTSMKWLVDSQAKRLVFHHVYGSLLECEGLSVLDVGAGFSTFTRLFLNRHQYHVIEMMAHDDPDSVNELIGNNDCSFLHISDWLEFTLYAPYDPVIANDLFPNVHQRLELFIDQFVKFARTLRLSLTYYNDPRYYLTRRLDADEILCILCWNGKQTRSALERFESRIGETHLDLLESSVPSIFPNERQVCIIELKGDAL